MSGGARVDGKLTVKQKRFCEEYIAEPSLNAGAAARKAGYQTKSLDNSHKIGSDLLTKPHVQAYISELMSERSKRTEITADMVIREFAKIGFANVADFVDDDGRMLPPGKIDRDNMAVVQEITERVYGGDERPIVERKYKLNDKISALNSIGKHLKMFTDKVETEVTHKGSLADLMSQVADE